MNKNQVGRILKNLTTTVSDGISAVTGLSTGISDREKLLKIIRQISYREGDFTLASGQKSNFYVDVKTTTLHPDGAFLVGKLMVEAIKKASWKVDAVGGLTLGADPIATSVSLAARTQSVHWPAFIVRKEPKGHGTGKFIEGIENLPKGGSLLILEDVTTTGSSAQTAIERVIEAGFKVAGVATVIDRMQGASDLFKSKNIPFISLATLDEVRAMKLS